VRDGTALAIGIDMKTPTLKPKHEATADETAAKIHKHERHVDAAMATAGGASMATVGALIGSIAGPPGAIAGAVMGAAIGTATGLAMESEQHTASRRQEKLDHEIGVTSESLGAAPVENVPPEEVPASIKVLEEMDAAVAPGSHAR
jgi:hypothetical protein